MRGGGPPPLSGQVKIYIKWISYPTIIIIEGLSLLQSIPPTTANKQTQAQKKKVSDKDSNN